MENLIKDVKINDDRIFMQNSLDEEKNGYVTRDQLLYAL